MAIHKPPAPGEQKHQLGEDGTRRAKLWLDSTTRVRHSYTNMDDGGPNRLSFTWPHGNESYSYDLGGVLRGKPYENDIFVAESKNYKDASDQGTHFDKFLAQNYCTLRHNFRSAQHFMWITKAPFRSTKWSQLHSREKITSAVEMYRDRIFGKQETKPIDKLVDAETIDYIRDQTWLIVLSERQSTLVISTEDRIELNKIRDIRELSNV